MTVIDTSSCFGDGQCWPPGFRFHPTDEELVLYYLKRKICGRRLKLDIIGVTDVYKWEPEDLPGQSKLKTGDRQWFFFSPRDRKYPNGARSNRATRQGYWKTTGKDRTITCNSRAVGVKKTLVFYKGRAPSGERTDWVMHEYTLVEEELKRCQSAGDYYALYKVYKKSGPGPKNGEQYGAPFREEDWADDEKADNEVCGNEDVQVNNIISVDDANANGEIQFPVNALEGFMNGLSDDPVLVQLPAVNCTYALIGPLPGEETNIALVDQSFRDANLHEQSIMLQPSGEQNDLQGSLILAQSTTSCLQLCETSEVTSASNIHSQQTQAPEDSTDFLEIDDLVGPVSSGQDAENPVESLQFQQFDGFNELDLREDVTMFLRDIGPIDNGSVSHSYLIEVNNEIIAPVSDSSVNNLDSEVVNPVSHSNNLRMGISELVPNSCFNNPYNQMVNSSDLSFDYQLQADSDDTNLINSHLLMDDQISNVATAESNVWASSPPSSGVVCGGSSANLPSTADQNDNKREDFGEDSWSSFLWAFVESIPTSPASAAESAFVNKAFQRMSSFGRMGSSSRISAASTSISTGEPTATLKRSSSSRYKRGFLIFSVLGVACAVLWVLIGTAVRVLYG
ncbi:hypothetical protein NMG60_11031497 [Bertholletia excelsa]